MDTSREELPAHGPVLSLGRYALFGELATGGMATVHYGRMSSLGGFNRTVAIKRMRQDIARDPEFVAMFLDEARLTSRIEHPNVVATLDVVAEAGEVFLVMEYVRGESLQRLRRAAKNKRERVPVPVAVSIMGGALSGLHAAHEAVGENGVPLGIVHRDVSPQNILVGEDGIARITDFGIAKAESRLQITHEGQMKGKLPYMAPEQLGSSRRRIDRRVDVFSAAVVLWELLSGKALFRADHPGETIAKVLSAPIPALPPLRADVTPKLDRVLRRALSRNPDQRPQTAEEFALALEEALDTGPASPRVVGSWVSNLAGEVLANRLRYVREMESTSWRFSGGSPIEVRASQHDPVSSDAELEHAAELPDLPVEPKPEPLVPPPPRVPSKSAIAVEAHEQRAVGVALPPEPSVPEMQSAIPAPPFVVPPPKPSRPELEVPLPPPIVQPSGLISTGNLIPVPEPALPADESSMPSMPSMQPSLPTGMTGAQSIPPFKSRGVLPIVIVGAVVASVIVLLVAGVVSSASWFGSPEPVSSSAKALPGPTKPPVAAQTSDAKAEAGSEDAEAPPSEDAEKGGSLETGSSRPVQPPPVATPKAPGTRPYLPDLP